jgi:hypothetical protein
MPQITLLDIAFGFLGAILKNHGQQLPAELVTSAQAAIDAWATHRADAITKAQLEQSRAT